MVRSVSDEVTAITDIPPGAKKSDDERIAHLIVLSGANVGQVFNLKKTPLIIGRDDSSDIQMLDAGISRSHARIVRSKDGSYLLEDAGSRNGTFSNNNRVEGTYQLRDGDKIQLGAMTVLKFAFSDDLESDYAQAMYDAANRDGLTGIFNRRFFEDRLNSEFALAFRHDHPMSLLMLDLDHFKKVNDEHGHPVGDKVLKEFAELLFKSTRTEDILARFGGEEFVVLCRHTDKMKASILGERIRHQAANHLFVSQTHNLNLTVSIGIAALPDPEITNPNGMLTAADECLYQAKERGRNCVVTRRS